MRTLGGVTSPVAFVCAGIVMVFVAMTSTRLVVVGASCSTVPGCVNHDLSCAHAVKPHRHDTDVSRKIAADFVPAHLTRFAIFNFIRASKHVAKLRKKLTVIFSKEVIASQRNRIEKNA